MNKKKKLEVIKKKLKIKAKKKNNLQGNKIMHKIKAKNKKDYNKKAKNF